VAITGYNNFTGYNVSGYMFWDITGYSISGILSYGVKVFCQSLKFSGSLVRCENVLRSLMPGSTIISGYGCELVASNRLMKTFAGEMFLIFSVV
jgi:hypothetical protein